MNAIPEKCPKCGAEWKGESRPEGGWFLGKAHLLEVEGAPPSGVKCWTCREVTPLE